MVPASSQNPQVTQQFLNSVLSQRGPSALPYSEDTKWLIRQHLVALTTAYPSLVPKTASFTHNDGRTVNLLQAEGTVPMPFQGVTYNIPVIIWLMESYPRHPPCVYVNPTRDMIIKRPHPVVNPSGLVSAPYLQNWVYPSSNLVDLVRHLSSVFGRDPPLYSQRRATASPPPPNPNPTPPTPSPGPNFGLTPHPSQNYGIHPHRIPPSPYGSGAGSQRVQTEDPTEVFKRNAVNKLVDMAHSDIAGLRKGREAEMEGLFNAQAVLRQREEHLNRGLKEMQDEKEGLEQQLQMVLMNGDILENWLRENEGKSKAANSLDVDEAFECTDPLSKQMLDCTAADLAIEDVVYSMDKALQDGAIPFDQYLRNVRLLSREQFFHRATGIKIRAVQMQAQVANMAARAPHYVS